MLLKFNSLHYAKPHLHEKSRDNISQRNWIQPNRLTERLRIACCLPRQTYNCNYNHRSGEGIRCDHLQLVKY